jgi:hypothetical protein
MPTYLHYPGHQRADRSEPDQCASVHRLIGSDL